MTTHIMTREFHERRRTAPPGADPLDAEALRLARSWHRHPALHDALWYRGINLGEPSEYLLFQDIVCILAGQTRETGP